MFFMFSELILSKFQLLISHTPTHHSYALYLCVLWLFHWIAIKIQLNQIEWQNTGHKRRPGGYEVDNVQHYQIDRNAQINGCSYIVIYTCNRIQFLCSAWNWSGILYAALLLTANYNNAKDLQTSICENLSSSKLRSIQKQILFTLKRTQCHIHTDTVQRWVTFKVISYPCGMDQ